MSCFMFVFVGVVCGLFVCFLGVVCLCVCVFGVFVLFVLFVLSAGILCGLFFVTFACLSSSVGRAQDS